MANDDFESDVRDLCGPGRYGNDSTPLVALVRDPHPCHWGKVTSGSKFESEEYLRFFYGKKKQKQDKKAGG